MKKAWVRIDISCPADVAEELAFDLAEAFGTGVEITAAGVRMYLAEESFSKKWTQVLERLLNGFRPSAELSFPLTYSYSTIVEEDWTEGWKKDLKPLRIGRRFVVSPTWETVGSDADRVIIRIDPGRAFGTGHHATTRLCLEWLEESGMMYPAKGSSSFLDVGTGSGILAIAAALAGFVRVVAVDTDPEAIEVAAENVRINGMAGRVQLKLGSVATRERFDVVIANIQSNPLIGMAQALAGRVADSGRLVLSGILAEQREQVRAAFAAHGVEPLDEKVAGEWCLLVFGFVRAVA